MTPRRLDRLGRGWDRSGVPGPGSNDDAPVQRRGAVPPPPSLAPGDAPDSVRVPRMEPPPPSLEAMVQSAGRPAAAAPGPAWWVWALLVAAAVALTGYVMR